MGKGTGEAGELMSGWGKKQARWVKAGTEEGGRNAVTNLDDLRSSARLPRQVRGEVVLLRSTDASRPRLWQHRVSQTRLWGEGTDLHEEKRAR